MKRAIGMAPTLFQNQNILLHQVSTMSHRYTLASVSVRDRETKRNQI